MNRKRNWMYFFLIALTVVLVVWKREMIDRERRSDVLSTVSEWRNKGKPVVTARVERQDVPFYIKVTAWQIGDRLFEGHVSKEVRDQVHVGEEMEFRVDGEVFKGAISMIADEISLETGMYAVLVRLDQDIHLDGWVVAYAHIDTLRAVICVSNEIVDQEQGEFFVWKAVGGKAVRQPVTIGQRDGYGAVVSEGLSEGDEVIVKGFSMLADGDRLNIVRGSDKEAGDD